MTKKFTMLLIYVFLCVNLIACGGANSDKNTNDEEKQTLTDISNENISDETVANDTDKVNTENTDRITRRLQKWCPIYYDYSSDYVVETATSLDVVEWLNPETRYTDEILIGLYDDVLEEFEGTLEDVIDYVNESTFFVALSSSGAGDTDSGASGFFGQKIEVTSSEKVTIAGYDSIRYTGTILNKKTEEVSWTCNTYGYTFIIDKKPYTVLGFVTTKEQEQSMIDEMIAEVDAIAASIRTEE